MQGVMLAIPKQEGLYRVGHKYFRVVKLFDICTTRHEEISKDICGRIGGCIYLGDCTIVYRYDAELGRAVAEIYSEK
jgi:hypothetical protein